MLKFKYLYCCFILLIVISCNNSQTENKNNNDLTKIKNSIAPDFNADSCYNYIKMQVDFGSRVPNTPAHDSCANYLVKYFEQNGASVISQKTKVKTFNEKILHITNIIAQYDTSKRNRILLFAHWDSRPFSDHSKDPEKWNESILGANDGASGVGVLMEMGRLINQKNPNIGIDIILFDAEDYGQADHLNLKHVQDSWCLGSQYWSKNPHKSNYKARYGILFDMVGAKNATFRKEAFSAYYAPHIIDKVWNSAVRLGYSGYFLFEPTGQITDDHYYINKIANIPSIDIIQHDPTTESGFGSYWHTQNDNMTIIDKSTLKAVGQTVLEVIYSEQ